MYNKNATEEDCKNLTAEELEGLQALTADDVQIDENTFAPYVVFNEVRYDIEPGKLHSED